MIPVAERNRTRPLVPHVLCTRHNHYYLLSGQTEDHNLKRREHVAIRAPTRALRIAFA